MERGPHPRRKFLKDAALTTAAVVVGGCAVRRNETAPQSTPEAMGGLWVTPSPENGTRITKPTLQLAAQAYPARGSDPAIASVQFTAHWPGAPSPDPENNPGSWPILATVSQHDRDNIYKATIDLNHVQVGEDIFTVPAGPLTISFDEKNALGKMKDAPNGEHHLIYAPQP